MVYQIECEADRALNSISPIGVMTPDITLGLVQRNLQEHHLEIQRILLNSKNTHIDKFNIPEGLKSKAVAIEKGMEVKVPNFVILSKCYKPEAHPVPIHVHIGYNDGSYELGQRICSFIEEGSIEEGRWTKENRWLIVMFVELGLKH